MGAEPRGNQEPQQNAKGETGQNSGSNSGSNSGQQGGSNERNGSTQGHIQRSRSGRSNFDLVGFADNGSDDIVEIPKEIKVKQAVSETSDEHFSGVLENARRSAAPSVLAGIDVDSLNFVQHNGKTYYTEKEPTRDNSPFFIAAAPGRDRFRYQVSFIDQLKIKSKIYLILILFTVNILSNLPTI